MLVAAAPQPPAASPKLVTSAAPAASGTGSAGPVAARPVCAVDAPPAAPAPTGKKVSSLSMGMERACAVLEDGRVSCWGGQWRGHVPQVIAGVDEAVQLAVVGHTQDAFVVRKNGSLVRVRPDGTSSAVPGLGEVVEVAAGVNLVAARAKDGTVQVTEILPGRASFTWQKLPAKGVTQVSAGGHVCALDAKGQVSCFTVDGKKIKPYSIPALGAAKRILSGGSATCATLADGTNRCFEVGQGPSFKPIDLPAGRLIGLANLDWNDGPMACLDTPAGLACKWLDLGSDGEIPPIERFPPLGTKAGTAAWVSNGKSACLLNEAGKVSCWGFPGFGLLGEPDPGFVSWPAKVPGVEGAVSVATGGLYTCASTDDGKVTCWGDRGDDKSLAIDPKVRVVPGLSDVAKIVRVDNDELCAVKKDGAVVCFGGRAEPTSRPQKEAPALPGFRQILYLNGKNAVAVLTGQGALLTARPFGTWDARMTNASLEPVAGVPVAARLFYEGDVVIAIGESEQAWTMDADAEGKLSKPRREPKLDGAKRLVSSWAILWNDGTVSFGDPRGGGVKREKAPPLVDLLDGRGPDSQLCGITTEGVLMCRGETAWSRLPGVPKVVAADSFWGQACVIDTCGAVHCWGTNWAGQAGVSGVAHRTEPRPVDL